jgi:hypothetical protein
MLQGTGMCILSGRLVFSVADQLLGEHSGGNWIVSGALRWAAWVRPRGWMVGHPFRLISSDLFGSVPQGSTVVEACWANGGYLVDSASSHMLVSKIKPCMSKYKQSIR